MTGEEVPILSKTSSSGGVTTSTEFKSVGIKLSVKPTMISGDRIRVEVNPEVSTVIGFSGAGDVSNPIICLSIKILKFGDEEINSPDNLDPRIEAEIDRIDGVQSELFEEPTYGSDAKAFLETGLEN